MLALACVRGPLLAVVPFLLALSSSFEPIPGAGIDQRRVRKTLGISEGNEL